jgi:inhibitor of cysteine peptidase
MRVIDEASAGHTVALAVGETVELRLKENPTTGYRWQMRQDGAPACRVVEDFAVPDDPAVPGRGGVHVWRIEGVRAGDGQVSLAAQRAWEAALPPTTSFAVDIRVAG